MGVSGRANSAVKRQLQVRLPSPRSEGILSLEGAISSRRSVRNYSSNPISLEQLSQILWAAQGITHNGLRSSPSAGALYPMELYVIIRSNGVENVVAGIYHYDNRNHTMTLVKQGDFSEDLQRATDDQESVGAAAVNIVITAIFERTTSKYGGRGIQYIFQESGHISQNMSLQACALGLASVAMGAFQEDAVVKVLGVAGNERPIYVHAIGLERGFSN